MIIKISKEKWEEIGEKSNWIDVKKSQNEQYYTVDSRVYVVCRNKDFYNYDIEQIQDTISVKFNINIDYKSWGIGSFFIEIPNQTVNLPLRVVNIETDEIIFERDLVFDLSEISTQFLDDENKKVTIGDTYLDVKFQGDEVTVDGEASFIETINSHGAILS